MKKRLCQNWLDAYLDYTKPTEIPAIYSKWTGLCVLSAAIQKKVIMYAGRLKIYPNLYVVLVGPPGTRKSESVLHGLGLLQELKHLYIGPSKCTTELLIYSMSKARQKQVIQGKDTVHTSYTVFSDEFESFLGYKGKNDSMIGFLTDIFGCGSPDFSYETISRGKDTLINPYLTLHAATTPASLANSLPLGAIGGGLTSRILFPTFSGKRNLIAFPEKAETLKNTLVHDLEIIHKYSGELTYSEEAKKNWTEYYENTPSTHDPSKRICDMPLFSYWYERKFLFIQKLAMLHAISDNSVPVIEWKYFEQSISDIEDVEAVMGSAFDGVGENPQARKIKLIRNLVEGKKFLKESEILSLMWREISKKDLEEILSTLHATGDIARIRKDETCWVSSRESEKALKETLLNG